MLKDVFDERMQYHTMQMIQLKMLSKSVQTASIAVVNVLKTSVVQSQDIFDETINLKQMWVNAEVKNESYKELCEAV